VNEQNATSGPPAQPAAPPTGQSKEGGQIPEAPQANAGDDSQANPPGGPYTLRDEERRHFAKVAEEARTLAREWGSTRSPEAVERIALDCAAGAIERCLEGYTVLSDEYTRIEAECNRLLNTVRNDQDRVSGPLGAGGRFVPPEEVAARSEPPPRIDRTWVAESYNPVPPGRPPAEHRAKLAETERENGSLRNEIRKLHREAELLSESNESLANGFRRYAFKVAGVDREYWDDLS
jgi:hypothetical protein